MSEDWYIKINKSQCEFRLEQQSDPVFVHDPKVYLCKHRDNKTHECKLKKDCPIEVRKVRNG